MEKAKVKIAILTFSTLIMAAYIISGIVADVSGHFPGAGQTVIKLILTLPFLVATLFSLLAGPLSSYISKKTLVVFSHLALLGACGLAYLLGGISVYALLGASIFIGVSQGILSTLSMALIADYYKGSERGALMGLQSTFVNFGGMLILFIGAALAGSYWKNTYLVLLVALPSLVIALKFLPQSPPVKGGGTNVKSRATITKAAWFYIFTGIIYGVFFFILQTNLAFYISQNGLGGADTAGYANSAFLAAGGLTGIFYGRLSKMLNRMVLPVGLMVAAMGYLQLYLIGNLGSVILACMCIGYSLTSTMPTIMFNASVVVPPAASTMAIALINTATNVGMFISPFAIGFFMASINATDICSQFLIGAAGMALLSVIYLVADAFVDRRMAAGAAPKDIVTP